ncbi:hypothetical protein MMC07_007879 [Pseudocyphellaria aurata]|nr:hypothetical protein [Pseudocyphellaria aurata]
MFGPNSVLILIATVSACALAFPAAQNSTTSSSASDTSAPIDPGLSSIAGHDDATCSGNGVGNKTVAMDGHPKTVTVDGYPEVQDVPFCSCIPFSTSANYIGINYVIYPGLLVFSDNHCNSSSKLPPGSRYQNCLETSTIERGVGSVMFSGLSELCDSLMGYSL